MNRFGNLLTSLRAWILFLTAVIFVVLVYYVAADRTTPFTTDAYVQTFVVQVAPQVAGQVVDVSVGNGSQVKKGDPLFRIDPRLYQYEVDRLSALLVESQTDIAALEAQLAGSRQIVKERQANVDLAQVTYDRISKLASDSFAAQQRLDEATDTLKTDAALLSEAEADVARLEAQINSMIGGEHSSIAQVRAELARARYNLAQTTVTAAIDGVIDNLHLRAGAYIDAGTAVMTLVDTSQWWIVANYQENALSVIRTGQKVRLSYFMYPGWIADGEVAAIGRGVSEGQGVASGMLPDVENPDAWITESQRFQVRIKPELSEDRPLRVGATVRTVVLTGERPVMNALALFWLWVGSKLDYIY